MTIEDAPPSSRRARREARKSESADASAAPVTAGETTPGTAYGAEAIRTPASGRIALGWLSDDDMAVRTAPQNLAGASNPYTVVSADLLARRPRRSPFRPGVVLPFLGALALIGRVTGLLAGRGLAGEPFYLVAGLAFVGVGAALVARGLGAGGPRTRR